MSLKSGTHLGPYEVLSLLGAGGMGEVYRARDTKLGREVAVKVLPEAFAQNPERLARFEREARLLASLNHPNIATLHGLEESNGIRYLIMELVPGDTLAERLSGGPLEVEEALGICTQIAEALEHAHEKGVIHRDLKPANVKVTPDGMVKVLDFGLAKAFSGDGADSAGTFDSNSPTLSAAGTRAGVILGTAAYMSPEQSRGKAVDKRTDIWAFGCVLYELLTGKQIFDGESVAEILGAIHHKEPEWDVLPETTPPGIRALLRRCLQKDAKRRLRDAADVQIQIEDSLNAPAAPMVAAVSPRPVWRRAIPLVLGSLVLIVLTGIAVWSLKPAAPRPVSRLTLTLPATEQLGATGQGLIFPSVALSPDGTHLAYVAVRDGIQQLFLRAMDQLEGRPMPGTEGAFVPFFSPDGQWVGFWAIDGHLKKVSISGGAPLTLCDAPNIRGGSWG